MSVVDTVTVDRPGKMSAAEILVAIAQRTTVFRAPDGDTAYATFQPRFRRGESKSVKIAAP